MRLLITALVLLSSGAMMLPRQAAQDDKKPGNPVMKTAQEFLATLNDKQ